MRDFGQRLKALREKRGLTQVELARMTGVHKMQLLRYEHGQSSPTAERIVALCRALRVTADVLLRGDRKGEESMPFQNIQLFERMRVLDRLSRSEQSTVLDLIDAVIARHEMKGVVEKRSAASS